VSIGRWLSLAGLVIAVGVLAMPLLLSPPHAVAQNLPPEVTYVLSCEPDPLNPPNGKQVKYLATVRNPNPAGTPAITYTLVRHWGDSRPDTTQNVTNVAPQTSKNGQVLNNQNVGQEGTHTLTVKGGDTVVFGPITKDNPCVENQTSSTT
jgi:hypothetical protein